jgi:DNA-binding transcriptional ArsR family regulator
MKDIDGNEITVGDIVKVIKLNVEELKTFLAEDEISHHLEMLNRDFIVDEIVWDGEGASVSIEWKIEPGLVHYGGLYLSSEKCQLVKKVQKIGDTFNFFLQHNRKTTRLDKRF